MVKIVTFFLIGMMILALFGKLRFPGLGKGRARDALPKPSRCRDCGRFNLTGGPCRVCGTKGGQ